MPDGRGLQCYRVTIECQSGRTLRPIVAAPSPRDARDKAATLAGELCRMTLPWDKGGKFTRTSEVAPVITDARRIHRWWGA